MRNLGSPNWLIDGDVAASVKKARQSDIPKSSIIQELNYEVFDETPKGRIKAIVDAIPDEDAETDAISLPLSQDPSTDADPRGRTTRLAASADISYLSPREAARVVGLVIEQFAGNTVRPPANESTECNLYWDRQHRTIGLRIVPAVGEKVGEQHLQALSHGETAVEDIRSPSEVALVTNGWLSEGAKRLAEDDDIRYFDRGHLEAWFRRAKITPDALGTVLEDGENHDGPLSELVDIPEIPSPISVDPFEMKRVFNEPRPTEGPDAENEADQKKETEPGRNESAASETVPSPSKEAITPSGETGTLYADPDEDGDYGAFERFVDDIESDMSATPETEQDIPHQPDESQSSGVSETSAESTTEESSPGVPSRAELLDELERLRAELGRPVARQDLKESTYNIFQYNSEFGGWTDALEAAGMIEDALLIDLERIWDIVERPPKQKDVLDYGKFEPMTYARQFDRSWEDILTLIREPNK